MSTASSNIRLSEDQIDFEPEVELISLITEKLPHYKLRADYSVRFSGYQHSDFNRAEQIKEQITELTNDQIHQTLEYFILCGLRVNKMTETYEDCQALTMLVQEQRSHLDLAASIGLNLVEKNSQLEQRVLCLEDQLEASKETMKQMRHQLTLKDDLLRMFHSEIEESEDQSVTFSECTDSGFLLDKVNVKQLETKLSRLEEENTKLRHTQHTITTSTDLLETKETQLVNDCVTHILESTKTIDRLSIELNRKTNDYLNQHEEISRLLTSKIDLENRTHHLLAENDYLITQLRDHQTKEFTLTKEIADMRDRYDECINLLNEKQDEIRLLKRRIERLIVRQVHCYGSSSPEHDSTSRSCLATELEESDRRGADESEHSRTMKIMEQARVMNMGLFEGDDETSSGFTEDAMISSMAVPGDDGDQASGNYLLRRSIQEDCERRRLLRRHGPSHRSSTGTLAPHSPTQGLETHYLSEALFHRQSSCNGLSSLNTHLVNRAQSPTSAQNLYKCPEKLQLIKPIEGSQTLRAWQNLATPSLTKALFEAQPHDVCFRGQQMAAPASSQTSPLEDKARGSGDRASYASSDYDEVDYEEPSRVVVRAKEPQCHSMTHTYSSSRILNPVMSPTTRPAHLRSFIHDLEGHASFSSHADAHPPSPSSLSSPSSHPSHDIRDSTPVNEVSPAGSALASSLIHNGHPHPSSWLDRFTVGSIMTSILGYSRPISSTVFTSAASHHHQPPSSSSTSPSSSPSPNPSVTSTCSVQSESSLIGRLTNLPPLAKRKPLQRIQTGGLHLLTSLAPTNYMRMAVHRMDSIESDDVTDVAAQLD